MKKAVLFFSFFLLAVVIAACGEVPTSAPGRQVQEATPAPWPAEAQALLDQAIADLLQRTGLTSSSDAVEVLSVEAVEWPNSCLGCPAEGESCMDVITPGYKIRLQVDGQTYEYHAGADRVVLCQSDMDRAAAADWGEAQPLVEQVLADLSRRASVGTDELTVLSVEAVDWPDACLGCPAVGGGCATVITPGYRILVEYGGRTYDYHTDQERVILCQEDSMGGLPEAQPLVERVVRDLAERLQISTDEITVVQVEEKMWRDSSLGCPQPGQMYLQVITPGYLIVLEAQGQQYSYHTGTEANFILCTP